MKPTIFFSHSSKDKELISPIKEHILKETGNTTQIFLSSDGASIPFGKNWLKEIEEALVKCRLMFIWVTPNSIKSNWIYFEAGYAYSRGINVIPLGFDGINLEDITAPLNFLQGFNIKSSAGLNNLIAIINDEFDLTFPDIFDEKFYENTVKNKLSDNSSEILKYVSEAECIFYPKLKLDDENYGELKENWLDIIKDLLSQEAVSYTHLTLPTIYSV